MQSLEKKFYIGIDLGTTNSAICSFDGENVTIWKSSDGYDVTPSAIYVDKRGKRYYGQHAYNKSSQDPDNSATLFKRFMGTSTKINLSAIGTSMTPEECSAEILQVLFGYLPEEIRTGADVATVITVPAAFNQMQKEATLEAANKAGLGKVALLQEPVAAIMSIMRTRKQEGTFLVYDLGGGTFDVTIADNYTGKVNLLALGGKASCGGRDLDRLIFNNTVVPWLFSSFNMPDDFVTNQEYKKLNRMAHLAVERAKIELSSKNESTIALSEIEASAVDLDGEEIYLDIPITREEIDPLFEELIMETIEITRETMAKQGLTSNEIDRIIFIGGPTNYKNLRDKVIFELGLPPAGTDLNPVNPMTAVAEGASIFAESIDWSTEKHKQKASTGELKLGDEINLSFKYVARTANNNARVVAQIDNGLDGYMFEITSINTGWISGRMNLEKDKTIELPLPNKGENIFRVNVYNAKGQAIKLKENKIVITKTIASIEAIPASHSVGVAVLQKLQGPTTMQYLVKDGEALPKKGSFNVYAGETIKAGSSQSLDIRIFEGDNEDDVTDNRPVGELRIVGTDFDHGIIPTGDRLECEYEVSDSGTISFEVSVPSIGAVFPAKFIIDDKPDLNDIDRVIKDGNKLLERISEIEDQLESEDPRLLKAREKSEKAAYLADQAAEPEDVQQAMDEVFHAKKLLAQIKSKYKKPINQMDLDHCVAFFNEYVREYARPSEEKAFDNQAKTAQRSIDRNSDDFKNILSELNRKIFIILWRQDWFTIQMFNSLVKNPNDFTELNKFNELKQLGTIYLHNDEIDKLRKVIAAMQDIRKVNSYNTEDMMANVNIIRGETNG